MSDIVIAGTAANDSSLDTNGIVDIKTFSPTADMDTMYEGLINKIYKQNERDYVDVNTALDTTATSLPSAINEVHAEFDAHKANATAHSVTEIVGASEVQTLTNKTLSDVSNTIHADVVHYEVQATEALLAGDVLVAVGITDDTVIKVSKRSALSQPVIGIAEDDIGNGVQGTAISTGVIRISNNGWSVGNVLYPDATGGLTTSTTIASSNYNQPIAYVVKENNTWATVMVNVHSGHDNASYVSNTPAGGISSTNVQDAINELDTEKLDKTGGVISSNLEVQGNFTVSGTTTTVNSTTVTTADNLIVINDGEAGTGVTNGEAGIQIDRGLATNYEFKFDESDDSFKIGEIGSLQKVATREDTPLDTGIAKWDNATSRFTTTRDVNVDTVTTTGNISVGGTVDGRDVATDGAKLDKFDNSAVTSITFNADGTMTVVVP